MKLKALPVIISILLTTLCTSQRAHAQIPTRCFEIQSILIDACGNPEGENEMVRIQVGPTPLNSNNLRITWPNNPWRHFCTAQSKIDSLNQAIVGCGYILAPPAGIIPAGQQLLIVTSTNMNVAFNSFANLSDTIYMLFQCAGNTAGHFANYSATPGIRTLTIVDTTSLCGDTVSYDRSLLTNINGGHGGGTAVENGGSVEFAYNNTATYYNNGCNAPFIAPSIHAGNDTTYTICATIPVISLHGTKVGGIRSVMWEGGHGTFSQPDSLNTTYTLSPLDVSPIQLYFVGRLCPDTLMDTIMITIIPPVSSSQTVSLCQGSSYHIGTHTYNSNGTYIDTLLTVGSCDSIVTTNVIVHTVSNQTLNLSGCGQVVYNGVTHTVNTTFPDTLRGASGCDSVRYTVNISITNNSSYSQTIMLCPGQSLAVGTHTYTTGGTYHDTLTTASLCDSFVTTVISYAVSALDAGNNVTICRGDSTQLHATGALTYAWSPTTGLSNPNISNPIAKPTTTTTYSVVSSVASGNQIINGDFSAGNTGFSSSYVYTSPSNINEGEYNVGPNPQAWNGGMMPCGDHTTGTGNMLIVNGATTANVSIYCQTVSVVPNTTYAFSTWLQSVYPANPAQLQFSINGSLIGPVFTAALASCNWLQFYTTWNSGTATTADICIVNQNTLASGNDFALDDISFSPLCTDVDSVTVTVIQPATSTANPSICQGSSYPINGHNYTTTGTYTDTLNSSAGCDSIITTNLTVINATSQALNLTGCGQVVYKGVTHTTNTTVLDTLRSVSGCDSVHLTVAIVVDTVINQLVNVPAACGSVTYNGTVYNASTTLTQTLHYQSGCDSIVKTVNIVVTQPGSFVQHPYICQGQFFHVGTNAYGATDTYLDTIHGGSVTGCDSIITTNLEVITPFNGFLAINGSCSVTYLGQTYGSSTTLHDTLYSTTVFCDSLYLTVTITVTPPVITTNNNRVCINTGQSYFAGGQNQTTSGIYADTVRTPGGCDSIYTITNLNVITPVHASQRVDSCYRATFNGTVYTADAIFPDTITSALGCDSVYVMDSLFIHSPTFSITSSLNLPLVEGDSTILTIIPAGTYQNVLWTPDSNIVTNHTASPTVSPQHTTTYTVIASDQNNCLVSGSIEIPVTANAQNDFIMPTAFSPNGDGMNELYKPVLRTGAEVTMFHIYNRWGELIYDKDRDNSDGWDGIYKTVKQPIGVYVYFISVKGIAGNSLKQQGNLTLLR